MLPATGQRGQGEQDVKHSMTAATAAAFVAFSMGASAAPIDLASQAVVGASTAQRVFVDGQSVIEEINIGELSASAEVVRATGFASGSVSLSDAEIRIQVEAQSLFASQNTTASVTAIMTDAFQFNGDGVVSFFVPVLGSVTIEDARDTVSMYTIVSFFDVTDLGNVYGEDGRRVPMFDIPESRVGVFEYFRGDGAPPVDQSAFPFLADLGYTPIATDMNGLVTLDVMHIIGGTLEVSADRIYLMTLEQNIFVSNIGDGLGSSTSADFGNTTRFSFGDLAGLSFQSASGVFPRGDGQIAPGNEVAVPAPAALGVFAFGLAVLLTVRRRNN